MRRGLVLGCGGPIGFAWTAVALRVLEEAWGWDARDAAVLQGTSAGAETAALLGSGVSVTEMLADLDAVEAGTPRDTALGRRLSAEPAPMPPLPAPVLPGLGLLGAAARGRIDLTAGLAGLLPRGRGDIGFLRAFADELTTTWVAHPQTRLVAADLRTGEPVPFGAHESPRASLADAMAASWAIPGWYPPVTIAGRRYVDGGAVSPTSAHLLADLGLDEVIVVPPMSSAGGVPARGAARVERLLRRPMTARVDREVALLESRGTRVIRIEPGADELSAMGANFTDVRQRAATLAAAREHLPARVGAVLERQS